MATAQVFVSYARRDRDRTDAVVQGLRLLGREVWLDEALVGGQAWWDSILTRIRDCDVFVQAISRAVLQSEACTSERRYAKALGKPIVPVVIEHVPTSVLPADLGPLQFVEYTDATSERAFQLAAAIQQCPPAPPPPDPPPAPPAIPLSYLGKLGEEVGAAQLSLDQQLALVARLQAAVQRPDDREGAVELLHRLQDRDDVYHAAARQIEAALATAPADTAPAVVPVPKPSAPAPTPPPASAPQQAAEPPAAAPAGTARAYAIKPHWTMAVLSLIFFFPVGIFSVIGAANVKPALERGDPAAAAKASGRVTTLFWITVAILVTYIVVAASVSSSQQ